MMQTSHLQLSIEIAGLPTRLEFVDLLPEKEAGLLERYAAFAGAPNPAAVTVRVLFEEGDVFVPFKGGRWQVETSNEKGRIGFASHFEQGWVDLNTNQGELLMRPQGDPENFLRVLYAWRLLDVQALLVHSSGVIRDGSGFVFFGSSGSGKTTITRLSPDSTILSDDLVILRKETIDGEEKIFVYGVPFRGEMVEAPRTNASAPVEGLFKLKKGAKHGLTPLSFGVGVAELSACVPFVMAGPQEAGRVLSLCETIVRLKPVEELVFSKDAGFWDLIG